MNEEQKKALAASVFRDLIGKGTLSRLWVDGVETHLERENVPMWPPPGRKQANEQTVQVVFKHVTVCEIPASQQIIDVEPVRLELPAVDDPNEHQGKK